MTDTDEQKSMKAVIGEVAITLTRARRRLYEEGLKQEAGSKSWWPLVSAMSHIMSAVDALREIGDARDGGGE